MAPVTAHGPLRRLVVVVALVGIATLVVACMLFAKEPRVWSRFAGAAGFALLAEVARVRVRRGGTVHEHSWREAALILSLVLVPPGQLIAGMCLGNATFLVARRFPATRLIFNLSLVTIEAAIAASLGSMVQLSTAQLSWERLFSPAGALVACLAALAAALVSTVLLSWVVALERDRRLSSQLGSVVRLQFAVWPRNVGAGFAVAATLRWSPIVAVLLLFGLLAVQFVTVDRTAIRQERFAWHRLQQAIDHLRDVELDELITEATTAVATMMRADAAEIEVFAKSGYQTTLRGSDIEEAHEPMADERLPGHSLDVALSTREGQIGSLRILFNRTVVLNETESDCLNAFGNALAVAIANALKFDSIREDAYRRVRAAYVDPVTGVGNLLMLEEEARATLPFVQEGNLAAIAVIGLNRFAEVNDLLGAHAADQMLRAVAARLSGVVRRCDVVARLHGAEYVLLFRELPGESAAEAQAEAAVRALGTAITADGLDLTVDAHTGVACAPADGLALDDLVRRARLAMYKARSDDVPVFRYRDDLEPPALAQVGLLRDLRDALTNRELLLHYQPKFNLRGGLPVAAEALVRWQHPERGMIPPAEFVPLLERCGLVGDLTRYVLESAIEECSQWQRLGLPLSVAVNLSARNLLDEDLPRFVLETLGRFGLPADRLICEITETAVFSRSPIAASVLDQLRAAGVELSLDDFCTGYSSLSLLRERTIDEIKIDRSFVEGLGAEARSTQIVTTLIELAHRCDIIVTAEGIETPEQQQLLTALGCDHAQGYLLARPMPAADVRRFFLAAMTDAPVTVLTREARGRGRGTRLADAQGPAAWREASSE